MNFKSILEDAWPIIEKVAPAIAGAIGGPAAGAAVTAMVTLSKKFGVEDYKQLANTIISDPDAETKLQEIDLDFSDEMTKAAVKSVGKLESIKLNLEVHWRD